jgi:MFS family permease
MNPGRRRNFFCLLPPCSLAPLPQIRYTVGREQRLMAGVFYGWWIVAVAFALTVTGLSATLLHQITFLGDRGIAPGRAAWVSSGTAALGVLGKLGFGALLTRFGHRKAIIFCFVLQCVGLLFLMLPTSWSTLALYVLI